MKKIIFGLLMISIGGLCIFAQSQEKTMYVAVKSTEIKSSGGVFADKLGVLHLGDTVTMLRSNGNWAEVRTANRVTGWVNLTTLSSKRVSATGNSASAGEIALAGKGFSPETEIEYRKSGLDYSGVDQMETITISGADLQKFIKDGHLVEGK